MLLLLLLLDEEVQEKMDPVQKRSWFCLKNNSGEVSCRWVSELCSYLIFHTVKLEAQVGSEARIDEQADQEVRFSKRRKGAL